MTRYVHVGTDAKGDSVERFQFTETLIDCQLLHPLLDENSSIAERTLARFIIATTVSLQSVSNIS